MGDVVLLQNHVMLLLFPFRITSKNYRTQPAVIIGGERAQHVKRAKNKIRMRSVQLLYQVLLQASSRGRKTVQITATYRNSTHSFVVNFKIPATAA